MQIPGLVKLLVQAAAGGESITLGSVIGTTLETIVQIVDHPATNAAGEPLSPAELQAKILEAIARAEKPFADVSNTAKSELDKLDAAK